jgi:hypothetical protein
MPIATRPGPPSAQETVRRRHRRASRPRVSHRVPALEERGRCRRRDAVRFSSSSSRSARSYAKARSARSWLARVTVNRCVSWVRAESAKEAPGARLGRGCKLREKGARPMENETLKSAVASLPDQLRVPLCLLSTRRGSSTARSRRPAAAAKAPSRRGFLLPSLGCGSSSRGAAASLPPGALERALEASEAIPVPSDLAVRLSESLLGAGARCGTGAAAGGARGLDVLLRAVLVKGLRPSRSPLSSFRGAGSATVRW